MSIGSKIEWCTATWSPTTGCDKVSPGCDHCYAMTMAKRLKGMGQAKYQNDGDPRTSGPGFGLTVHEDALGIPLRCQTPHRWFVNSMSDLFHARVPAGFVGRVWDVMGQTPQHTYQILTKRPERMRAWVQQWADRTGDRDADGPHGMPPLPRGPEAVRGAYTSGRARLFADMLDSMGEPPEGCAYPPYDWMEGWRFWPGDLFNVWLGTSIELDRYCRRADDLRETPAAVRFLSLEPLLAPLPSLNLSGIGWCIIGGESGRGARRMEAAWARDLIAQCREAGVPVFVKQLGSVLGRELNAGSKGGAIEAWPEDLRIREFPQPYAAVTA